MVGPPKQSLSWLRKAPRQHVTSITTFTEKKSRYAKKRENEVYINFIEPLVALAKKGNDQCDIQRPSRDDTDGKYVTELRFREEMPRINPIEKVQKAYN